MKDYVPIAAALLSGVFALAGVVVAGVLASRKDRSVQRHQAAREAYEGVKAVYCDAIACLEKCIREVAPGHVPGAR